MKTIRQTLSRLEALQEIEKAFESRSDFDRICLKAGLSPIDVAELLAEETGYDWISKN